MLCPPPANILLYGNDPHVLESRRLLLQAFGHRVWIATQLCNLNGIAPLAGFDLLILCHSLSMEERGRVLSLAQSQWPLAKTLVLTACAYGGTHSVCSGRPEVIDGPAKLLSTVSRLVAAENTAYAHH